MAAAAANACAVSAGQHPNGFREFLRSIPDEVDRLGPLELVVPWPPAEHVAALMKTLGVDVVIEPDAEPHVRTAQDAEFVASKRLAS